jgi:hypothetical protein
MMYLYVCEIDSGAYVICIWRSFFKVVHDIVNRDGASNFLLDSWAD